MDTNEILANLSKFVSSIASSKRDRPDSPPDDPAAEHPDRAPCAPDPEALRASFPFDRDYGITQVTKRYGTC
jgi:hypothetical protein